MSAHEDPTARSRALEQSLDSVDRKLRELQREIAAAGSRHGAAVPTEPQPSPGAPPPAYTDIPEHIPSRPPVEGAAVFDVRPRPQSQQQMPGGSVDAVLEQARVQTRRLIGEAEATAARIVGDAQARADDLRQQIDGLVKTRDLLHQALATLALEYAEAVERVGREPQPTAPAEPQPPHAPPQPPGLSSPASVTRIPDRPPGVLPERFRGNITLEVQPVADVTRVTGIERALAALGGVTDVYLRSLEGRKAMFELELQGEVDLIAELDHGLGQRYGVQEAATGFLSISLRSEPPDDAGGTTTDQEAR